MKETSFLLRPPTVCPSCRLSQKNHSQAKSERRGGGGRTTGRTEPPSGPVNKAKQKEKESVSFLDDSHSFVGVPDFCFSVSTKTSDYKNIPRRYAVFSFSFFSFPPLASFLFPSLNVHPPVEARPAFRREVFSLCASCHHKHIQPFSHSWMNMTVLLKNLK